MENHGRLLADEGHDLEDDFEGLFFAALSLDHRKKAGDATQSVEG